MPKIGIMQQRPEYFQVVVIADLMQVWQQATYDFFWHLIHRYCINSAHYKPYAVTNKPPMSHVLIHNASEYCVITVNVTGLFALWYC